MITSAVPASAFVDFAAARRAVVARQAVTVDIATRRLGNMIVRAGLGKLLAHLKPGTFQKLAFPGWLRSDDDDALIEAAIEVVGMDIPLSMGAIEDIMDGNPYIAIEPQGIPIYSWDDLDMLIGDVSEQESEWSLPIFFLCLGEGYPEAWDQAVETFNWPAIRPFWWDDDDSQVVCFRENDFFKSLEAAGLAPIKIAYQFVWKETGNIWIDFNPADDGYQYENRHPEWRLRYTVENFEFLKQEYEKSQELWDQYRDAMELGKDPNTLVTLLDLYGKALDFEQKSARPHTLAEMWAGDDGENENDLAEEVIRDARGY